MARPPRLLANWLREHLFDVVPMAIVVIDQHYDLVYANDAFERMFGAWRQRKCYQVYKSRDKKCARCHGARTFTDGKPRVNEEVGYDREGRLTRYIKHTIPVADADGSIPYLIDMCTDITESEQIRREYQLLFDQVPCNVLIIDRDYRIVKTNARARDMLGDLEGLHCYSGLKGEDSKCGECTARQTFADGRMHTGHHVWRDKGGQTVHLHVITVPLRMTNGEFDMVMELAVDVTESLKLQDGLQFAHAFLETIVTTSMDGIFAVDGKGDVTICNPAARKLFAIRPDEKLTERELSAILPAGFLKKVIDGPRQVYLPETRIVDVAGCQRPVRLVGHRLLMGERSIGAAFSIQDLSELKQMEEEKLEAERLAAVGQTVAGLAHGIKNLTTALDGGMYMLNTGIGKGDLQRIQKGMVMLDRNTKRISHFVKAFLGYAKGRRMNPQLNDPNRIAKEVAEMYQPKADKLGIELILRCQAMEPAPLDYESLHESLTNLVGNALDACVGASEDQPLCGTEVKLTVFEKNGTICYEVSDDGCGMEEAVRNKVFTTFFTTKGLGGTGLGLLMTRKIIQEHGGGIKLHSRPGKGTTFRVSLPRKRLPAAAAH